MPVLCVCFSFQIACLVPVDQFQLYKRLKFERGANLLVSITFLFKVSVEAAVLHTAKTKPVGWVKEETEEMTLLWNSLRAITSSDCSTDKFEILSVEQNQQRGILLRYHAFTQACGQHSRIACLRLHRSSQSILILGHWGGGCTGRTTQGASGWYRVHIVLSYIHRDLQNFWEGQTLQCGGDFC